MTMISPDFCERIESAISRYIDRLIARIDHAFGRRGIPKRVVAKDESKVAGGKARAKQMRGADRMQRKAGRGIW